MKVSWLGRRTLARSLDALAGDRRWLAALAAVNLAGAVYGFWWYRAQLAVTRWWLWPLVADSPLAALAFGAALVLLLAGRRPGWLWAYAYFGLAKYGLWAAGVLAGFWATGGGLFFVDKLLLLSHLGMVAEAAVFYRAYRVGAPVTAAVGLWFILNDLADYPGGLHPAFPASLPGPVVAGFAAGLTGLLLGLFLWLGCRRRSSSAGMGTPGAK